MNTVLSNINGLFYRVQDYIDPISDLHQLTEQELSAYLQMREQASRDYNVGLEQLRAVVPTLSVSEIVEGYTEGCRLLQRGLSGYMSHYFNPAYVPIMKAAIDDHQWHTACIFLQALADHLGSNAAPTIIEALDSPSAAIREKALLIADQLELLEALPKVQRLIHDPVTDLASLAEETQHNLQNKSRLKGD
jgi:HEAT repeat protein